MSTAVLEQPMTPIAASGMSPKEQAAAELQARIQEFVMPKPKKGDVILWYPNANRSEESEVGHVAKTGHRNIVIRLCSGVQRETVRHLDDPKLQLGSGQRENGAWDFTDKDKSDIERDKQIAALQTRVAELEALFNEPAKPNKEKQPS